VAEVDASTNFGITKFWLTLRNVFKERLYGGGCPKTKKLNSKILELMFIQN